jgi:hypothetical protein
VHARHLFVPVATALSSQCSGVKVRGWSGGGERGCCVRFVHSGTVCWRFFSWDHCGGLVPTSRAYAHEQLLAGQPAALCVHIVLLLQSVPSGCVFILSCKQPDACAAACYNDSSCPPSVQLAPRLAQAHESPFMRAGRKGTIPNLPYNNVS